MSSIKMILTAGNVILSTDEIVGKLYHDLIQSRELESYFLSDTKEESKQLLKAAFQYIVEKETALANIHEFAQETTEIFAEQLSDNAQSVLKQACINLGENLLGYLDYSGAFDKDGVMRFEYAGVLGDDVVVTYNPNI